MRNKQKVDIKQLATNFVEACNNSNWKILIPDSLSAFSKQEIVRIVKVFEPHNNEQFICLDMEWSNLLSMLPSRSGSTWGTDGSGVGAVSAIRSGQFIMSKSGIGIRLIKQIKSLI